MPAELKPVTVPALAVNVGFFFTKYTLGRAIGKDSNEILVTQFPSVTPRIFNGIGSLPITVTASLDGVAVCDQIHHGLKDDSEILARVDLALRQGAKTVKITGRNHEMQQYWPAVSSSALRLQGRWRRIRPSCCLMSLLVHLTLRWLVKS